MVEHAFDASTRQAGAADRQVSEFEASWSADEFKENQGYTERPCPGRGKQKN